MLPVTQNNLVTGTRGVLGSEKIKAGDRFVTGKNSYRSGWKKIIVVVVEECPCFCFDAPQL